MATATAHSGSVDRFLDTLALDGFSIGIRESLTVHRLADMLSRQQLPLLESLAARAMFTALIARDPAEQRRVAELYDRVFAAAPDEVPTIETRKTAIGPPHDPQSLGRAIAVVAAIAIAAIFLWWKLQQPTPGPIITPTPKTDLSITNAMTGNQAPSLQQSPGEWTTDALYADLDRLIGANKISAAPTLRELQKAGWPPKEATANVQLQLPELVERLQLPPDWPIDLNDEAARRKIMNAFADYGIASQLALAGLQSPEWQELNSVLNDIDVSSGQGTTDFNGRAQASRVARLRELLAQQKKDSHDRISPDLLDRALAIKLAGTAFAFAGFADASWIPSKPASVSTAPSWLRPAAMAMPLAVLGLWFLGLASRRRAQIKRRADAASPLDHQFVLEAPEDIRLNRTDKAYFMRVAASLNVRQTVAAFSIDPARTIRASIAAGGLFTPVRGRITTTPAYLLLVEARGASDQEARRLEMLHQRLVDAGVNVKRFFYFNSPAWLHAEFDGNPQPIEDVAAYHEDRRLIILGEGRGFLMPLTNKPESWAQVLAVWPQRAMLTPRPLDEWGTQEFTIARELGLPLGRATIEGLFALAELLGLDEGRDRPLFRAYRFSGDFDLKPLPVLISSRPYYWLSESDPGEADAKRLEAVLRYYLDSEGLLWLKALAVYPAMQWDLTLYLGRALDIYHEPRLAALTLLPWLREGHMPQWLRKRFIATLPDDIRVRTITAIHALMTENKVGDTTHLKLLREDPLRHPSLRGRQPSRDALFLETLGNEGDFPAPDWLKPGIKSWFATLSWNDVWAVALAFIYAAAIWWLAPALADGALGPGAFMPLTALAVMPAVGWLGLAYFEDRLHVPDVIIRWWAEVTREPVKPQNKEEESPLASEELARLGRSIAAWWRNLMGWSVKNADIRVEHAHADPTTGGPPLTEGIAQAQQSSKAKIKPAETEVPS